MNEKESALQQKAREIERSLNQWREQSGLFQEGDLLKFTLTLCSQPPSPVQVNVILPHAKRTSGRGVYYIYSQELTEDDWQQIFAFPFPDKHKRILALIKESGNRGVQANEFKQQGLWPTGEGLINSIFKQKFRVRHPEPREGKILYGTLVVLKILGTR